MKYKSSTGHCVWAGWVQSSHRTHYHSLYTHTHALSFTLHTHTHAIIHSTHTHTHTHTHAIIHSTHTHTHTIIHSTHTHTQSFTHSTHTHTYTIIHSTHTHTHTHTYTNTHTTTFHKMFGELKKPKYGVQFSSTNLLHAKHTNRHTHTHTPLLSMRGVVLQVLLREPSELPSEQLMNFYTTCRNQWVVEGFHLPIYTPQPPHQDKTNLYTSF